MGRKDGQPDVTYLMVICRATKRDITLTSYSCPCTYTDGRLIKPLKNVLHNMIRRRRRRQLQIVQFDAISHT